MAFGTGMATNFFGLFAVKFSLSFYISFVAAASASEKWLGFSISIWFDLETSTPLNEFRGRCPTLGPLQLHRPRERESGQ